MHALQTEVGEDGANDAPQVQDLLGDSALLERAESALGRRMVPASVHMKNLVKEQAEAEDDPLEIEKIRFWGKAPRGPDYMSTSAKPQAVRSRYVEDSFFAFFSPRIFAANGDEPGCCCC